MTGQALDLVAALGATSLPSVDRFTVYIPDCDRHQQAVSGINVYIETIMLLLTDINGGVTRLPWSEGMWKGDEVVRERTALVYSNIVDADLFVKRIDEIRAFLHMFGREANQGEVMIEFSGEGESGSFTRTYSIREFDEGPPA